MMISWGHDICLFLYHRYFMRNCIFFDHQKNTNGTKKINSYFILIPKFVFFMYKNHNNQKTNSKQITMIKITNSKTGKNQTAQEFKAIWG
jgi:hypothetical protein